MSKRRNPYLILGLKYGASKEEARRAVARVSRRVRGDSTAPYSIEDVTWALHQVEQAEESPESSVSVFRVPANAELFEQPDLGPGLFNPAPAPMERSTEPPSQSDQELIAAQALGEIAGKFLVEHPTIPLREPYYEAEGDAQ